ncbi:hypothetical protein VIBRN418_10173 [Vibrio sp. N418]|uniref:Uncharacterized protein n=2 Tax=Vibrio scophthalmi TaxID=45658 RepID=F9RSA1_9VIBR|nr:hypothetical protein VIS19158_06410 [Vibrio scophthalmi LMG 19158]EGU32840.1 hypothetical protein VIBRN418_10173 [Vibrio sp. N418]ODS04943.1 hypothetical protein VSF3289_04083 [Vibrio scophthalmi]
MLYADMMLDLWSTLENILLFIAAIMVLAGIQLGTHSA